MYFERKTYNSDLEILVTEKGLVAFSGTVSSEGVTADENGKKYVTRGAFIDADGKVVTQTGSTGSETLSATPVGVLKETVDVTHGDQPCSLIDAGYLRADRVLDGFADKAVAAIKTALPRITFR